MFVDIPRVARVPISGLNNQLNEYIIELDDLGQEDLEVRLTDHYAIQLDFQWLWDENKTPDVTTDELFDEANAPLSPWMTCKYRF